MHSSKIQFFTEDISFEFEKEHSVIKWLQSIADSSNVQIEFINYIFCSDPHILKINKSYLKHDYYTDIITFHYHEPEQDIESDIYISIDRVKDNAQNTSKSFEEELMRVIAHGLLHLIGYNDKDPGMKEEMRKKEDWCLSLRDF